MATCFSACRPCVSLGGIYLSIGYSLIQTLGRRDVLLMALKFLRKAFKSDCRWSAACPLDVVGDTEISQHGDSHSLSFCRLALHAISRYCRASPKMDVSQIVVSRMPPTLPGDGWYISIAQWHQACCQGSADPAFVCAAAFYYTSLFYLYQWIFQKRATATVISRISRSLFFFVHYWCHIFTLA